MTTSTTALSDLFGLIYELHSSSEAVNAFDVRSESPSSRAEFRRLVGEEKMAVRQLVDFVRRHHGEVIAGLDEYNP